MENRKQSDEVRELVKDARLLMLTVQLHISRHTMFKTPFSQDKREQVYKEIEEMQKRLDGVNTSDMKSSLSPEAFVVFKARFLQFEHEVIDFINLFHVRVFSRVSVFQRDLPKRKYWKICSMSSNFNVRY